MAEGGQAILNTRRLEPDALRQWARVRVGEMVDGLEAAVRRELGAGRGLGSADLLVGLHTRHAATTSAQCA
jgi:hypothetical protein